MNVRHVICLFVIGFVVGPYIPKLICKEKPIQIPMVQRKSPARHKEPEPKTPATAIAANSVVTANEYLTWGEPGCCSDR